MPHSPRVADILRILGAAEGESVSDILDRQCQGDLELRRQVEAALAERGAPNGEPRSVSQNQLDATSQWEAASPVDAAAGPAEMATGIDFSESPGARRPACATRTMPPSPTPTDIDRDVPHRGEGLLGGRYRLGEEIARGGMGSVTYATDLVFNRAVAVKQLRGDAGGNEEAVARFYLEAHITSRLQHPGIPPVHDLGDDGGPFLVMKLIQGETLARLLARRESLSDGLMHWIDVFQQVAQTVGFAHSRGVIHRDLKPLNIMVGAFGEVQVMDWGIAKEIATGSSETAATDSEPQLSTSQFDSKTIAGAVMGTLAYMAPEQAQGQSHAVDARADVFSLGAILCEILTGRPAYAADTVNELYRSASSADLTEAHAALAASKADPELVALARRCLEAEAEERPENGSAVAELVASYREGLDAKLQAAEAEKARTEARLAEQKKRRRVQLALALAVGALILGASGFWVWKQDADQRAELREAKLTADLAVEENARLQAEAAIARRRDRNRQATLALLEQIRGALVDDRPRSAEALIVEAKQRLDDGGAEDLAEVVAEFERELASLNQLHTVDNLRWMIQTEAASQQNLKQEWARAFSLVGVDFESMSIAAAAEKIDSAAIRPHLLARLEVWRLREQGFPELLKLLISLDDDPFRNMVRESGYVQAVARLDRPPSPQPDWFDVAHASDEELEWPQRRQLLRGVLGRSPNNLEALMTLSGRRGEGDREVSYEVLGYCRAALAMAPDTSAAWNNMGVALVDLKQTNEAADSFRKSIELLPRSALAHQNLGAALADLGELEEAIACEKKALELDPELSGARANLASFYLKQGQLAEAEQTAEEALSRAPAAFPWQILGRVRLAQGDAAAAIDAFQQALKLDPYRPAIYSDLAATHAKSGDPAAAEMLLLEGVDRVPSSADLHIELAKMFLNRSKARQTLEYAQRAIALDPQRATAHLLLGRAYASLNEWEHAAAALSIAVEKAPEEYESLLHLGTARVRLQQFAEAVGPLQKAIELKPNGADAHAMLGTALFLGGDREAARPSLERAAELRPRRYGPLLESFIPGN